MSEFISFGIFFFQMLRPATPEGKELPKGQMWSLKQLETKEEAKIIAHSLWLGCQFNH
jgi:hypothetical protein